MYQRRHKDYKKIENTKSAYKEFKNCICMQARHKKWPKAVTYSIHNPV